MPTGEGCVAEMTAGAVPERVRDAVPLFRGITNCVAMTIAATAVIASGAGPAMVRAAGEARRGAAARPAAGEDVGP
jgi:hydroxyethylthiazole kinase-like sugar kinase family protein